MKKLVIESIPHADHRKEAGPTVGDWFTDPEDVQHIRISELTDERFEKLIAVHELIEKILCDYHGIEEKAVDQFDAAWKEHDGLDEPGNDPQAPYHRMHRIADVVERLMAVEMKVNWDEYEAALDRLFEEKD